MNKKKLADKLGEVLGEKKQDVKVFLPKKFIAKLENILASQAELIEKTDNKKELDVVAQELGEVKKLLDVLNASIKESKIDRVEVSNFPEQKEVKIEQKEVKLEVPDEVSVKKPSWFKEYSDTSIKELISDGFKYLAKQFNFDKYTEKKNALAVRLVDKSGQTFYDAMFQAISGGLSSPLDVQIKAYNDTSASWRAIKIDDYDRIGTNIAASDSPSIDAFSRWRVSNPETIFDSKQTHDNQPLFWDDQEISGGGTTSSHSTDTASTTIGVALNTAGNRTRQTFRRFNYQPGKSQLIFITTQMNDVGGTGIKASVGLFDDNNGLFFTNDDGTLKVVRRTYVTGGAVDNEVTQANWNIDTMDGNGASGITIDPTKTQILLIDYEWLGVGRVRMGFVIDGIIYYCHEFLNTNNLDVVYMSTPNLPIRYELINDGTGAATEMQAICCSVMSEGGLQENGQVRYASTANTQIDLAVVGTVYGIKGIRLKAAALDEAVQILQASILVQSASDDMEWFLIFNPTVANAVSWSNETNSSVQTATGAANNTITNGTYITGGYVGSGSNNSGSATTTQEIKNSLLLGSSISGTPDTIWLAGRALTNVNTLVEGSITWRELS